MKLQFSQKTNGHVLMTSMFVIFALGLVVTAYLQLMMAQVNFTARSQTWNNCLPIAEAGIEEAMQHLNHSSSNLASDGWSSSGGAFTKTRNFNDDYFVAEIYTNGTAFPYIISKGYAVAPVTVAPGGGVLASAGPTPGLSYILRTVKVTTTRDALFNNAMVVRTIVDFNGNNVLIDSYDNDVAPYNAATAGDKGDVVCNSDMEDIRTGNANIKGHVSTGPGGSYRLNANCSIGDVAWVNAGTRGIKDGWWRNDANLTIPDVNVPWISGAMTPSGQGNFKYVLADGYYEIPGDLILRSTEEMMITGNATLWVKGNVNLAGTLRMKAQGYRLTLYCSGNASFTGTYDKSIDPKDLLVYGLPTCRNITVSTGSKLEWVCYAPSADITIVGNGNFFGSITANSARMTGSTGFHYDESLAKYAPYRPYVISSWEEL